MAAPIPWLAPTLDIAEQCSPMQWKSTTYAGGRGRNSAVWFGMGRPGMPGLDILTSVSGSDLGIWVSCDQGGGVTLVVLLGVLPRDHMGPL